MVIRPRSHNTKRMRTYQVGTSNFDVHDPRHIHVGSVYAYKQFQKKLSEYVEDSRSMSKSI